MQRLLVAAVMCLWLARPAPAAVHTVTTNADAGPGSLRAAILAANTSSPPNTIAFSLSPARITPLSPLPALTNATLVDGTTHPVYVVAPIVVVDGAFGSGNGPGLQLGGTGCVLRALQITSFTGTGVRVGGNHHVVESCWIVSNLQYGVVVNGNSNRIGGLTNSSRNLVYGNAEAGLVVEDGRGNELLGQWVGLRASGLGSAEGAPQQARGIWLQGGEDNVVEGGTGAVLVVAGNDTGLEIGGGAVSNTVRGAWFGLDEAGTGRFPNGRSLVILGPSHGNRIGGAFATERNIFGASSNAAIALQAGASNNTVQGNVIGQNVFFFGLLTNLYGIHLSNAARNVIGGPGASNNLVSCLWAGVLVEGEQADSNVVQYTTIGAGVGYLGGYQNGTGLIARAGADGTRIGPGTALVGSRGPGLLLDGVRGTRLVGSSVGVGPGGQQLPNQGDGVRVVQSPGTAIGDGTSTGRNLIAWNFGHGISIQTNSVGTVVAGNWIGVVPVGGASIARTNFAGGIWIHDVPSNVIGVAGAEWNVISGNDGAGIRIEGSNAVGNVVARNYIGLDIAGTGAVPNTSHGLHLREAKHTRVGGAGAAERNVISGNDGYGIWIEAGQTFSNVIAGNYVGTRSNGFIAVSNVLGGVRIESWGNRVGGADTNERNVIAGNAGPGLWMAGPEASNNVVWNNYIGLMASGLAMSRNVGEGVRLDGGAALAQVGGPGVGNLIAGNTLDGVLIAGASTRQHRVQGNWIGTYANGTNAAPNLRSGIALRGTSDHTIGGTNAGEGNLIAASGHHGVGLETTSLIRVWGNRIGADATGNGGLGNASNGVYAFASSGADLRGNQIADNDLYGVWLLLTTGAVVRNNLIGTGADGLRNLGNASHGVLVAGVSNSVLDNRIAWTKNPGVAGVALSAVSAITPVRGNVIFSNGPPFGIPLDLNWDGFTANDPAPDPDVGANLLQNFPIITSALQQAGTALSGYLASSNATTYTLEFFASDVMQGGAFLGSTNVTTSAQGTGQFDVVFAYLLPTGARVHATATDPYGRTSEYSPGVTNRAGADADGDGLPDAWEQQAFGTLTNGAAGDVDDDGYANEDEYVAGTHPTNGLSFPGIYNLARAASTALVQVLEASPGRWHQLEANTNLPAADTWQARGPARVGEGALLDLPDDTDPPARTYRVRVSLP